MAQPSLPIITSGGLSPDIASLIVWDDEAQSLAWRSTVTFGFCDSKVSTSVRNCLAIASPASEKPTVKVTSP
jgi:hypothetical protein